MQFVWFWTFWHWSKESFREGLLLRSPLHGLGSHWDEWFRHEASESDRQAIGQTGQTTQTQRRFISWLLRHWAREAGLRSNGLAPRFVLGQLAQVQPFNAWAAFEKYRVGPDSRGLSAIVLTEKSLGEPDDVRPVEALALPFDPTGPEVVPEGFQAGGNELEVPRLAARSLLQGQGFLVFFGLWLVSGRRPYPRWLAASLGLGWLALGGAIVLLLTGPDPGERLVLVCALMLGLWSGLVGVGVSVAGWQGLRAWRQGQDLAGQLERGQVRLRMGGGLTLQGGSAGLPFCLHLLLSVYRAQARTGRGAWLWDQFFARLRREGRHWAATGVVTADGHLKPVVVEAKIRACARHPGVKQLLTPRQAGVSQQSIDRQAFGWAPQSREPSRAPRVGATRLGYAAERPFLRVHPCRHVAQAMMQVGGLTCSRKVVLNVMATVVSLAMLVALPDLRSILFPPAAPSPMAPSSPSPYYLWVSLDTKQPDRFQVVLESDYWSNRRAEVKAFSGANASIRAEIPLRRLARGNSRDVENGTVWIERRHRFLNREFIPGERVGRYSFSFLNQLAHE